MVNKGVGCNINLKEPEKKKRLKSTVKRISHLGQQRLQPINSENAFLTKIIYESGYGIMITSYPKMNGLRLMRTRILEKPGLT